MMKKLTALLALVLLITASCDQPGKKPKPITAPQPANNALAHPRTQEDTLYAVGEKILISLKNNDVSAFSAFFSQDQPVLFAPYAYIDPNVLKKLNASDLLEATDKKWILTWGQFDGSGDPIRLTIAAYFQKFVYNADYLTAPKRSIDLPIGKGNSTNNVSIIFPDAHVLEYHSPGSDSQYNGMDWTSLRLVLIKEAGYYRLVAVVHDQWTI